MATDMIADTLGVEPRIIERPKKYRNNVPATKDEFSKIVAENKKKDYISVRDNLANIIAEVEMVVGDAVEEVRTNPSARLYETFALLVKTYSELNKDLLAVSNDTGSSEKTETNQETRNPINNVVFVGTSESLVDQIKKVI